MTITPNHSSTPLRVAVVTGAAQGVGKITALRMAKAGYQVFATDVQAMSSLQQEASTSGWTVYTEQGDVADEGFVAALAERVLQTVGRVDVVVNNAGISLIEEALTTTSAQWQRVMSINALGPFLMAQRFAKPMLVQGSGAIVNVASVAGISGIIHRVAYNASKHALVGMTRTLAAEWGGRGIRVNAVAPGWIKTEMDYKDQGSGAYRDADIEQRVPMGRFAAGHEIAEAILFLADPERASFINGVVLPVDGGWSGDGSWDALRLKSRAV